MQNLLYKLLRESNIFDITEQTIGLQLKSHPNSTSIKAISDTLDYFGIQNLVANVPKDALTQLPKKFLALLADDNASELVFVKVKKNKVLLLNEHHKKYTKTIDAFKELWTGTIIALESDIQQKKPTFLVKNSGEDLLAVFGLLLLAIPILLHNYIAFAYTCLSLMGVFISFMITREEIGVHTKVANTFCRLISKKTDCKELIRSKKHRFLNFVQPGDASMVYFVSTLCVSTFIGFTHTYHLLLGYMSLMAVILSVYYQAVVVKKWCPLCLGVVGILLCQFALLFFTGDLQFSSTSIVFWIQALGLTIGIFGLWSYLKSSFITSQKLASTRVELLKFKRSDGVFNFFTNQQKLQNTEQPDFIQDRLVFGNPNAGVSIKAVTNPLCGYCTESFMVYDHILKTHSGEISLELIFNTADDIENLATKICLRIIEIYIVSGPEEAFDALKQWFEDKNYEKWQKKFGKVEVVEDYYLSVIHYHTNWCNDTNIDYTPATFIGNNFFPHIYKITDLPYFISDMIESKKEKAVQ